MVHRGYAGKLALFVACLVGALAGRAGAEEIRIGLLKSVGGSPVFIAQDKGFFAAEGLTAKTIFFETANPIAVAAVSGDLDVGITGLTASFYSLAGRGELRIIGGYLREMPGFRSAGFVISNRADAAGLKSFKDFPGHSVAIPVLGSPPHYSVGLIAEKYGFDLKTMRFLQMQSNANQVSAVVGGQVDIAPIQVTYVMPAIQRGDAKLLAWVGDETPWQLGALFTPTRIADQKRDMVERFLRAYRKGARLYHDAFTGPDEKPAEGPTAPDMLAIIGKAIDQPADLLRLGLGYIEPDARIDEKDVLHQIAWYQSQGLIKGPVDGAAILDPRYVVDLP